MNSHQYYAGLTYHIQVVGLPSNNPSSPPGTSTHLPPPPNLVNFTSSYVDYSTNLAITAPYCASARVCKYAIAGKD